MHEPPGEARTAWEAHYAAKPRVWSGRVNPGWPKSVRRSPAPGLSTWGAAKAPTPSGWPSTAGRWSPPTSPETALERAREAARTRGVADRIEFRQLDLARGVPDGPFDLVSAQFCAQPGRDGPACQSLRQVARTLAPGGTLPIVDHAAAPPWASKLHHHDSPPRRPSSRAWTRGSRVGLGPGGAL